MRWHVRAQGKMEENGEAAAEGMKCWVKHWRGGRSHRLLGVAESRALLADDSRVQEPNKEPTLQAKLHLRNSPWLPGMG